MRLVPGRDEPPRYAHPGQHQSNYGEVLVERSRDGRRDRLTVVVGVEGDLPSPWPAPPHPVGCLTWMMGEEGGRRALAKGGLLRCVGRESTNPECVADGYDTLRKMLDERLGEVEIKDEKAGEAGR